MSKPSTTLNNSDFKEIAVLHIRTLPSSFLSKLGVSFLSALYQKIYQSKYGYLCVIKDTNHIQGFVAASSNLGLLKKDLLKSPLPLILTCLPFLFKPYFIKRIINHFIRRSTQNKIKTPTGELIVMAVDERYRNKHLGKEMFNLTKNFMRLNGEKQFAIMVGKELTNAQFFYENNGAKWVSEIQLHKDNKSVLYICQV